jgi:hypothetical protein
MHMLLNSKIDLKKSLKIQMGFSSPTIKKWNMSILIFRGFFPAFTLNVLICFIPSEEIPKIALDGLSKEKEQQQFTFFFPFLYYKQR